MTLSCTGSFSGKAALLTRSAYGNQLVVTSEELSTCKDELELQFSGKKLDKKDFFGSSDPFLTISKANETGKFTLVHRTEHVKNNVNPIWRKVHS